MFLDRMPAGHFLPSLGKVLPHEMPVSPWLVDVDAALSTYRRAYTASARCGILIPQPWFLVRGTPSPHTNRPSWGCYEHLRTTQPVHTPSFPG